MQCIGEMERAVGTEHIDSLDETDRIGACSTECVDDIVCVGNTECVDDILCVGNTECVDDIVCVGNTE